MQFAQNCSYFSLNEKKSGIESLHTIMTKDPKTAYLAPVFLHLNIVGENNKLAGLGLNALLQTYTGHLSLPVSLTTFLQ